MLHWSDPLGLTTPQYYYMTIFSVLFIHYAFDGYFFFVSNRKDGNPDDLPLAVLAMATPRHRPSGLRTVDSTPSPASHPDDDVPVNGQAETISPGFPLRG